MHQMAEVQVEFTAICRIVLLNMRSSKIELRRVMATKNVTEAELGKGVVEEFLDVLVKVGLLEKLVKRNFGSE